MRKHIKIIPVLVLIILAMSLPVTAHAKTYKKDVNLYIDQKCTLKYKGLSNDKAKWSVKNPKMLSLSKGSVTAKKVGKTTVTATYKKNKYVFNVSVSATRKINSTLGSSQGITIIIVSISKDKVVWKLKNKTDQIKDLQFIYFTLDDKVFYTDDSRYIIAPKKSRTFTFKRNKNFTGKIPMNSSGGGIWWYSY